MGKSFTMLDQHLRNQVIQLVHAVQHLVIEWIHTLPLMKAGLKVMIGKGDRSDEFVQDMIGQNAVYLQAVGGAGVLLSKKSIKE